MTTHLSDLRSDFRYRLVGPKAQVTKVEKGQYGLKIHMRLSASPPVIMIWDAPTPEADVRVGDLLTLYTEILAHDPSKELQ